MHSDHFTYAKRNPNQVKNRAIQTYDNLIPRKTLTLVIQPIKSNTTLLEFYLQPLQKLRNGTVEWKTSSRRGWQSCSMCCCLPFPAVSSTASCSHWRAAATLGFAAAGQTRRTCLPPTLLFFWFWGNKVYTYPLLPIYFSTWLPRLSWSLLNILITISNEIGHGEAGNFPT